MFSQVFVNRAMDTSWSLVPRLFLSLWSQVLSGRGGRVPHGLWFQVPFLVSDPGSFRGGGGTPWSLVPHLSLAFGPRSFQGVPQMSLVMPGGKGGVSEDRGTPPHPSIGQNRGIPLPQDRTASACYAAGGTPLAVKQEDFLIHFTSVSVHSAYIFCDYHHTIYK